VPAERSAAGIDFSGLSRHPKLTFQLQLNAKIKLQNHGQLYLIFPISHKILHSFVPRPSALMDAHHKFTEWAVKQGADINGIAPHRFPGQGLGIIAEKDFKVRPLPYAIYSHSAVVCTQTFRIISFIGL
jgi:hypothetical protein